MHGKKQNTSPNRLIYSVIWEKIISISKEIVRHGNKYTITSLIGAKMRNSLPTTTNLFLSLYTAIKVREDHLELLKLSPESHSNFMGPACAT